MKEFNTNFFQTHVENFFSIVTLRKSYQLCRYHCDPKKCIRCLSRIYYSTWKNDGKNVFLEVKKFSVHLISRRHFMLSSKFEDFRSLIFLLFFLFTFVHLGEIIFQMSYNDGTEIEWRYKFFERYFFTLMILRVFGIFIRLFRFDVDFFVLV